MKNEILELKKWEGKDKKFMSRELKLSFPLFLGPAGREGGNFSAPHALLVSLSFHALCFNQLLLEFGTELKHYANQGVEK